jgi:hypothetical protein
VSTALAAALRAVRDRLAKLPRSPRWIAGGACAAILVVAGIAIAGPQSHHSPNTLAAQSSAVRTDPRANRDLARTTPSPTPTTAAPSPSAVTATTPPPPKAAPTTAQVQQAAPKQTTAKPAAPAPVAPAAGCSGYSGNQLVACNLLPTFGFSTSEMSALVPMWNRESGWSIYAANPSGAYGIPQALPGSKMAAYGSDWQTNPATQIKWGLSYIKSRYGSPSAAWSFWQSNGWY